MRREPPNKIELEGRGPVSVTGLLYSAYENQNQKSTPSVVLTPTAPTLAGGFTLGLDLGNRSHYVCVLDATGQIRHEEPLVNDRVVLALSPGPRN